MTLSPQTVEQVRLRANNACEYCGVSERDCAGTLTVDHYRPRVAGGSDALDNLVYCCFRCNLHKADYWPQQPGDPFLWNPRTDSVEAHLLLLANGQLYPITSTGMFTLQRLRLNRPGLVAHRVRRAQTGEMAQLLVEYQSALAALRLLHERWAAALAEHQDLLQQQKKWIERFGNEVGNGFRTSS